MTHSRSPSLHAILEESSSDGDSTLSEGESLGSPLSRAYNTMIPATPLTTTPPLGEIPTFQTTLTRPQWTTTSTTLPEQLAAHLEGRRCAPQDNIKRKTVQHRGRLVGERAAAEARLANWIQCESALEEGQGVAKEHAERRPPTFAKASQNVTAAAALLDVLSAPSTDGVGEVYQWLKSILGVTTMQQAESSLLHQVEAYILPLPPTLKTEDRRPPKELWKWEQHPHQKASRPAIARSDQGLGRNPRHTCGITQGMMARSPSHARGTHIVGAATIMRDVALVPKGLVPRHSVAPCAMLIFHDIFER
jgi:hypothetical protein